jgi:putative transposase
VHAELARLGHHHGRRRIARLMRRSGLRGKAAKRWKRTTIPDLSAMPRPDLIGREFTVDAAAINFRWCGDITYIPTGEGWLYLATVIDIASRRVVGHAMADHLRTELPAAALANALAARDPAPGVIFHADRGCQYTSAQFAELAAARQVRLSHGRTASAGTTPWPKASSAQSRANCSTTALGLPALPPGGPSPSTSPGTTAPGYTAHSATRHPPNSKPAPNNKDCRP